MKAIIQTEYGSADVLSLVEVDPPAVSDHGVLVRVHAASVHAGDWHLMRGTPLLVRLLFGGLRKPKIKTLGTAMAGQVEAIGKAVTQYQPGDQVFGELSEVGFGAFAEYVCVPEQALALKPTNLTFEQAATVPVSGLAALQGLRDVGQLQPGQKVLITGAGGGVGSFAMQIARALGAEVTATCSPSNVELVRSLGAVQVLDSTQAVANWKQGLGEQRFDVILDTAAYRSVFDYLPALKTGGTYVMVGGDTARFFQVMFLGPLISWLSGRRVKCLAQKPNQADLAVLRQMIEAGKISPCVGRHYPLSGVPAAIRDLEQRRVSGKIAISIYSPSDSSQE